MVVADRRFGIERAATWKNSARGCRFGAGSENGCAKPTMAQKNFSKEPGDLLGKSDDNPKTRWMSVNELVNGDSTSNKWGWRRSSRFLGMGGFVSDGDWAGLNHWIRMFYIVLPFFPGCVLPFPIKKHGTFSILYPSILRQNHIGLFSCLRGETHEKAIGFGGGTPLTIGKFTSQNGLILGKLCRT